MGATLLASMSNCVDVRINPMFADKHLMIDLQDEQNNKLRWILDGGTLLDIANGRLKPYKRANIACRDRVNGTNKL